MSLTSAGNNSNQQRNTGDSPEQFDYIVLGAGCSGLSLVARIIQSGHFKQKKILLIDKSPKKGNDKTWCFWDAGNLEASWKDAGIVHHQWTKLWLKHPAENLLLNIAPYSYKMIRSEDFYRHCFNMIRSASNVQIHFAEITGTDPDKGTVTTTGGVFSAPCIFSSVLLDMPRLKSTDLYLLQHFKGWWIETDYDAFDPEQADLMNFCTPQNHGCTFVYVLPVSKRRALIEYTLFTEEIITDEEYDAGLRDFISIQLKISGYKITDVEKGVIPMTNFEFLQQQGKVFFIGTAGGQTKASSGYTFSFIQKQSEAIVNSMIKSGVPVLNKQPARFHFYDTVLLKVLHERKIAGADVFYSMFKKNKTTSLLRFLDNESNLFEELAIMNTTKKRIFIPAAIKALQKK
ncbi:MAG: lycopene cyclase family protein [Bacteroidota bacterium]